MDQQNCEKLVTETSDEPTKIFNFGQHWQVYGTNSIEVPAHFTIEQAIEYVKIKWDDIGLATEFSYVMDSDYPDFENCDFSEDDC